MTVERHFVISGWWVSIGPSPAPGTHNLLQVEVWETDSKTGDPTSLRSSVTITRNQLFDVACGLLCTVLETEPEGVFDTSYALDTNTRALGLTDNVKELLRLTQTEDPSKAYTQTMKMFRRLENRLPVLQACQRALEVSDSEFDVNHLMETASKMEREVVGSENSEVKGGKLAKTGGSSDRSLSSTECGTPEALGFKFVPERVLPEELRGRGECWFRVADRSASVLAKAADSINGFLWKSAEGEYQIRTDPVSFDRPTVDRVFSPCTSLDQLSRFCDISLPAFEALASDNKDSISVGEAPSPSSGFKALLLRGID